MDGGGARELLVVWWSATGGTRQLVDAFAAGARQGADAAGSVEVIVRVVRADRCGADELLAASGVMFASPENLGAVAGMLKDFFDRTYYAALDRINGRPYATLVCAGTDGEGATRQIDRVATGWRLRRVAPPLIVRTGAQTPEAILAPKTIAPSAAGQASELGEAFGAGLALGVI